MHKLSGLQIRERESDLVLDTERLLARERERERLRLASFSSSKASSRASSSGERDSLMTVLVVNSSFGAIPGKAMVLERRISLADDVYEGARVG